MLATCQVFHVQRKHLQAPQKGREYEYKGKKEKRAWWQMNNIMNNLKFNIQTICVTP